MKIRQLVPSLNACRMIPSGEFDDSLFVWMCDGNDDEVILRENAANVEGRLYPAPTLHEIISKASEGNIWMSMHTGGTLAPTLGLLMMSPNGCREDKASMPLVTDLALKMWLELHDKR